MLEIVRPTAMDDEAVVAWARENTGRILESLLKIALYEDNPLMKIKASMLCLSFRGAISGGAAREEELDPEEKARRARAFSELVACRMQSQH